ncbi:hypothetical protein ACTXT7_000561 [Hymenolepis weldensis]
MICNFLAHEKCIRQVVSPCTCIIPFLIQDVDVIFVCALQDPMAHCWSEVGHFKRKFCNVCRKRLDDLLSVRCERCNLISIPLGIQELMKIIGLRYHNRKAVTRA